MAMRKKSQRKAGRIQSWVQRECKLGCSPSVGSNSISLQSTQTLENQPPLSSPRSLCQSHYNDTSLNSRIRTYDVNTQLPGSHHKKTSSSTETGIDLWSPSSG